ncbi:phosphoglycerate dehydrogenase [Kocuria coralli]|uniref:D-3-phosphoglycerate dehydrogenase n=1 Tax=Kocuria coralli TaxID=1461025 RepID=A0A5J5KU82_9MICC|nr:phosphoglycerate dehydrogenase [Kocuria coralli]KAA9392928.1 phosphoglycerate dehydrogenase [Kocuria coralli]
MKALLLENIHTDAEDILRRHGIEVETRKGALDEAELIDALEGVDLLGIRSKTTVSRAVFEARPNLMAVGAFCIGTNQIDLAAATASATPCFNAPYSNTRSVVELAVSEIIAMARHLTDKNAAMHAGNWDKSAKGAHEVRGRTLGLIGYGNIGKQLSVLAEAMGMQVYFYDLRDELPMGNAKKCNSMDELFEKSETISVHVDGRLSNEDLIGRSEFEKMRPRTLFLNLSRGHVVDMEALRDALKSGHIAGAGIDVYPEEPKASGDPFTSPLQGIPNVILTPHVGGSTAEAQENIGNFVAAKMLDYLEQGSTSLSVNFPQVQLRPVRAGVRLLHVHENVPGVLTAVNTVLSEHGVNVDGQRLVTEGHTGYLVTDCTSGVDQSVVDEILALKATMRLATIGDYGNQQH